jgi:hypothetical protein
MNLKSNSPLGIARAEMSARVQGSVLSRLEKLARINLAATLGQTQTDAPGRCFGQFVPHAGLARAS